ncbi:MAG: transcription elongation factor GreA [Ruminococcus sp.]|jgi:transcription elongation factor GreA|nr:transcription elongation factor GreA [Ruminococcus sp.]
MAKLQQMTREGYDELQERYKFLTTVKRAEVGDELKEARSQGDLSENAEYDEAKNKQGILEAEIAELKKAIDNAEIVEEVLEDDIVVIGTKVRIKALDKDKIEEFKIVGTMEADFTKKKIGADSPVGKAVMHKKVGDVFSVEAPVGNREYELLEIFK